MINKEFCTATSHQDNASHQNNQFLTMLMLRQCWSRFVMRMQLLTDSVNKERKIINFPIIININCPQQSTLLPQYRRDTLSASKREWENFKNVSVVLWRQVLNQLMMMKLPAKMLPALLCWSQSVWWSSDHGRHLDWATLVSPVTSHVTCSGSAPATQTLPLSSPHQVSGCCNNNKLKINPTCQNVD